MDRDESHIEYASKCARLLAMIIFVLMILSFCLHLCAFGQIIFQNIDHQKNQTRIDLFDENLLPIFCLFAHLIWTIVPIVIVDQCCISTTKNLIGILLKLFVCTCPLLLCHELSLIVFTIVSQSQYLTRDFFLSIVNKWLIFIATILISFWTGILSDKNKWRGIHGGQVAPQLDSPLFHFEN